MKARSPGLVTLSALTALAAALLVQLPLAAQFTGAQGSFERTLQVTGPVDLEVTTGSGRITVRTGEGGRVYVRGLIRANRGFLGGGMDPEEKVRALEANPPIVQSGNVIRVGHIADRELRRNVSISYELVVPVETRLRSNTGSGDQTIEGLRGPVDADTGSGSLHISNIGDEVKADTGSGDVVLNAIQGSVKADTGSGSIRAYGVAGGFVADTGSGSVRLEQTKPGEVRVDTGSGSVEVRGVVGALYIETGSGDVVAEGQPTADWRLSTGSGSIRIKVPPDVGFDFHAHTGSGSIYADHPVTVQGAIKRSDLRGQVRGGGYLIDAETGSGSIRIE